ncbi:MAG: ABC transporter ATP-binding protein [Natronomonas sp.]|uniref:ABC transporter ATP-binding protein n=1 Tax=Natronomonas sp. TaxID=2184060 RepID=UPI0028705CA6|nr:ABC transporter ATP-binding protein [Natronomonas sp.]MDR9431715.1 ABC transporter ATP-binding protein [Natronomonas sp.]
MLEIEDLTVSYGDMKAIEDLSLTVESGSLTIMLGSNGAGKTTCLKTISRLLEPDAGRIAWEGDDLLTYEAWEIPGLGIAHIPEGSRVFPEMTVMENLMIGADSAHGDVDSSLAWVHDLFPVLEERSEQVAQTLSGGEQQMLAIARGLMLDPDLLLMDEPSLGLAPSIVADVFEMIDELRTEDITILLVEQNASRALSVADYGYVLEAGRLVVQGDPDELREEEAVRQAYLGH